ncbi:LmbU family transcriptional regulator [Saccharothrix saharensis]|uniref:LmbU family transcriptional regulator n=1 Tax=Saccharothrix saharensis TaxID=571190 RepID=UPI00369321F1
MLATVSGLAFPKDLTFDAWQQAGLRVARIANSSAWYLGDWLVYGKEKYRDRYRKAIDLVGLDYQTLRNYAWVARKVEHPRRRKDLSFQHHAEVASLPPADQSRWLGLAERHGWTRSQLRQAVRGDQTGVTGDEHRALPRLSVPGTRVEVWREAAARADVEFDVWIVRALDRAAGAVLDAR